MKNFKLLQANVDTRLILDEIDRAIKKKWIPSDFGVLQKVQDIEYRVRHLKEVYTNAHINSAWQLLISQYRMINRKDQQLCNENSNFLYKTRLSEVFPETLKYLTRIATDQDSYLQRVSLVLLPPNDEVLPHVDHGNYYKYRNRYHLVLKSEKGSEFRSGNEKQLFKEKELWWFANKEIHSVKNLSDSDRIHLIFDLLPKKHFSILEKCRNGLFSYFFQIYYDEFGKERFHQLLVKLPPLKTILILK